MLLRLLAVFLLAASLPAFAQDTEKPSEKRGNKPEAANPVAIRSITRHRGTFNNQPLAYTAIAGETFLKDKDGTPTATIVSTTYLKDNPEPDRPVTFLFNGGPGSGSLWLHMGAFGPKRVNIPNAKDDGAPPYPITANPDSLLDVTDLVFIDPVGTGFSRALGKTDPKTFYGVTADAKSVAAFIRLWLTEHGRWNAPKFLGGESYGTTRSAAVTHELTSQYNDVALNGVILISTILDFGLESDAQGNELSYVVTLPSMAAAAHYHKKSGLNAASVEAAVEQARAFALGPYAAALLKGKSLPEAERAAIRTQLAAFTGLTESFLENANLRVSSERFYKELLRDRGLTIGRLDARYTGVDYDRAGEGPDNDPSFYGIDAAYPAAMNAYVRGDLGLKIDRDYISIGGVGDWDWKLGNRRDDQAYITVAPYLARALRENSGLKIFVGQGWYDFATPFFAAEYSLNRPGFPDGRIEYQYYQSGHMMYVQDSDRTKLSNDIRAFIRRQK